ncbi:MAG TPA: hypothetical protein PKE53_14475 [Flavobacteriales bacterium]|jgi:hypothetical protein|nr:hypothetical protein [Flavobacteriales bacterium]
MRTLNEFEQALVRKLLQANSIGIPSLPAMIDDWLRDIDLVHTPGHWEMHFDAQQFQGQVLVDRVREFSRQLVSLVHLLRELEVNGLVILYDESPFPPQARFGQLVQGNQFIPAQVHDARVNQLLDQHAFSSILVQPGLIAYVRDGFRMPDEVRADNDLRMNRRNLRIAAWALVLGVGIGLWQVCLAYREIHYGKLQVEQTQQVQLDSAQYNMLLHRLDAVSPTDTALTGNDSTVTRKACCAKH